MSKTILTIDDSASIRQMVAMTLSAAGLKVIEAGNGAEGYDKATSQTVHAVITDLNMPVMNGYETIAALKAQWPHIKIIAFSITNTRREEERALEAGAHAFVSKLSSIVELQKVLHDVQEPADSGC